MTITGRKKSLIVNREGKNIHPEEVEHHVCKSPYIREASRWATGRRTRKSASMSASSSSPTRTRSTRRRSGRKSRLSEGEIGNLIRNEVKEYSAGIAEYKRPRRIQIRWEEFDKTSTGKVKRYLYCMGAEDVG